MACLDRGLFGKKWAQARNDEIVRFCNSSNRVGPLTAGGEGADKLTGASQARSGAVAAFSSKLPHQTTPNHTTSPPPPPPLHFNWRLAASINKGTIRNLLILSTSGWDTDANRQLAAVYPPSRATHHPFCQLWEPHIDFTPSADAVTSLIGGKTARSNVTHSASHSRLLQDRSAAAVTSRHR